jgi:hypothetical protein
VVLQEGSLRAKAGQLIKEAFPLRGAEQCVKRATYEIGWLAAIG